MSTQNQTLLIIIVAVLVVYLIISSFKSKHKLYISFRVKVGKEHSDCLSILLKEAKKKFKLNFHQIPSRDERIKNILNPNTNDHRIWYSAQVKDVILLNSFCNKINDYGCVDEFLKRNV